MDFLSHNEYEAEYIDEWLGIGNAWLKRWGPRCHAHKSIVTLRNNMRLSVLICTIPERQKEFERLYSTLKKQWHGAFFAWQDKIEIIAISDERRMTIGEKRNKLLDAANGKYVCFVDDDDFVSDNYLGSLYAATQGDPDAIGFVVQCNDYPKKGMSKLAKVGWGQKWEETAQMIFRPVYHKTPVRREYAQRARFPHKSYGEDAEYSKRLAPMIETVEFLDKVLYYYNNPQNVTRDRYRQR